LLSPYGHFSDLDVEFLLGTSSDLSTGNNRLLYS
jgi:hypothetical protein